MPICRVLVFTFVCAVPAWGAAPPWLPSPAQIERWVRMLGSNDFAEREEASARLAELVVVPPSLLQATKSDDAEVRRRAVRAVQQVRTNAEERALARWLQQSQDTGIDLVLDLMALRKGGATRQGWLAVAHLARSLTDRARALGWNAATPADQDFLRLPVQRNLPLGGATRARVLVDRPEDSLVNTLSTCLVIASGPVGRLNCVDNSVVLVTGDIEGINGSRNSLIVCLGSIGSLNWTENCIIVASAVRKHNYSCKCLFEVRHLGLASESENNLYINRKEAAAEKRRGDRFLTGVQGPWDQLRLFDPRRVGLVVTAKGMRIDQVVADRPFARAGARLGDEVRAVNGQRVSDVDTFRRQLCRALAGGEATLELRRQGKTIRIKARLD